MYVLYPGPFKCQDSLYLCFPVCLNVFFLSGKFKTFQRSPIAVKKALNRWIWNKTKTNDQTLVITNAFLNNYPPKSHKNRILAHHENFEKFIVTQGKDLYGCVWIVSIQCLYAYYYQFVSNYIGHTLYTVELLLRRQSGQPIAHHIFFKILSMIFQL